MAKQEAKTTVYLKKPLLHLAKRKALEEEKTLKQIFHEALIEYLGLTPKKTLDERISFGGYDLGKIRGTLSREEIYDRF